MLCQHLICSNILSEVYDLLKCTCHKSTMQAAILCVGPIFQEVQTPYLFSFGVITRVSWWLHHGVPYDPSFFKCLSWLARNFKKWGVIWRLACLSKSLCEWEHHLMTRCYDVYRDHYILAPQFLIAPIGGAAGEA